MDLSAELRIWLAVGLLPVGGYALATAAAKGRAYLPLAALPLALGLQQVFEAGVLFGLGAADPDVTRAATAGFLLLALVVLPVAVPLAAAALELPGYRRFAALAFAAAGLATACGYGLQVAAGAHAAPGVLGGAIRYDLPDPGPVWPAVYLAAVCVPPAGSRDPHVRPLGWLILTAAVTAYAAAPEAFASTWAGLAALASGYVAVVVHRLPGPRPEVVTTGPVC